MNKPTIISKRLKALLNDRGLSAAELARMAEVRTSFIYDVLSGKSLNPSTITLARVANALAIPLHELLGQDSQGLTSMNGSKTPQAFVQVPKLDIEVSAGGGSEVIAHEDAANDQYAFRKSWIRHTLRAEPNHLKLLDIKGDSMEPTLHDGDMILVNTEVRIPTPPGIFVLHDGFGLVAKRLQILPDSEPVKVSVISENPQYAPYERSLQDVRIIGKVVWFARKL